MTVSSHWVSTVLIADVPDDPRYTKAPVFLNAFSWSQLSNTALVSYVVSHQLRSSVEIGDIFVSKELLKCTLERERNSVYISEIWVYLSTSF